MKLFIKLAFLAGFDALIVYLQDPNGEMDNLVIRFFTIFFYHIFFSIIVIYLSNLAQNYDNKCKSRID